MINLAKGVEVTATIYASPFIWSSYKYCNTDFDAISVSLKEMYIYKYNSEYSKSTINPFKVSVLGLKRDASTDNVWLTIDDPLRWLCYNDMPE